jgi:hypothetical protein
VQPRGYLLHLLGLAGRRVAADRQDDQRGERGTQRDQHQ